MFKVGLYLNTLTKFPSLAFSNYVRIWPALTWLLCSMIVDWRHLEPVSESPHLLTTTGLAELVWDLKQVTESWQSVSWPGWEVL